MKVTEFKKKTYCLGENYTGCWANFNLYLRLINQESPTGFEPADKRPIEFKVKCLDHSAIVTWNQRDHLNNTRWSKKSGTQLNGSITVVFQWNQLKLAVLVFKPFCDTHTKFQVNRVISTNLTWFRNTRLIFWIYANRQHKMTRYVHGVAG